MLNFVITAGFQISYNVNLFSHLYSTRLFVIGYLPRQESVLRYWYQSWENLKRGLPRLYNFPVHLALSVYRLIRKHSCFSHRIKNAGIVYGRKTPASLGGS